MSIERDPNITFDPEGTLRATTRWVSHHEEGLAEWLKNVRRAYQIDRAAVADDHRIAAILMCDAMDKRPARIGLLDVGGATIADVNRWSEWQSLTASHGSVTSLECEEQTQGNGGKAYMYRLFTGKARILGVQDGKRNCKGFEGPQDTVERGTPGFIANSAAGREAPIGALEIELDAALKPYQLTHRDLPKDLLRAIRDRKAFTLVEGAEPRDDGSIWHGKIDSGELVERTLRNDQTALVIEQLVIYAAHNGRWLNEGKRLELEPIASYAGFETPRTIEVPEQLPDARGTLQSTTLEGTRPKGRLIIRTSRVNMYASSRKLRPRWKVSYRSAHQMIGSKLVSELIPTTPGNYFVYATVELAALEPDYVTHGRVRPSDGPLLEALDLFIGERLREIANEINARRRHEMDKEALDQVHRENQELDHWKNQFLIAESSAIVVAREKRATSQPWQWGTIPFSVEIYYSNETLRVAKGVNLPLSWILKPVVRDSSGRPVRDQELVWISDDPKTAGFRDPGIGELTAFGRGTCGVRVKVKGYAVESDLVAIEVWNIDHVLLTPRDLQIPLGTWREITAEVTNDEGVRSTNVLLDWEHDADDPLILRIRPTGVVTGNRLGRTSISAGAGDPDAGGVWARVRVQAVVTENPKASEKGLGFPTLKVTGRDEDPETGRVREGDPDQPALWQDPIDFLHNIWWLNLESSDAAFAFAQREEHPELWRSFHAQVTVEMVVQVLMLQDYTNKKEGEQATVWAEHRAALDRLRIQLVPQMWEKLKDYVSLGRGLE
jgi:hypothetical protein